MTEAGANMFTFHVCVVVGGSNDRSCCSSSARSLCWWVEAMTEAGANMFTFHVCVVWKQWQKLGLTCLRSMFVL